MNDETERSGLGKDGATGSEHNRAMPFGRAVLLGAVSGGLILLSFPPPNLWPLAYVALIPLLYAVISVETRAQAIAAALIAGLVGYVPLLAWLSSVTVGGWLALSGYIALYLIPFTLLGRYFYARFPRMCPLYLTCAWVGLELFRAWFATGFPWLFIGYTQYAFKPLIQVASITGVYGVSWIVVFINVTLASLILHLAGIKRLHSTRWTVGWNLSALAAMTFCVGWGALTLQDMEMQEGAMVGLVQPNVVRRVQDMVPPPEVTEATSRLENENDSLDSGERKELQNIVNSYWRERDEAIKHEITQAAALSRSFQKQDITLLVWPETTVQVPLNVAPSMYDDSSTKELRRYAGETLKTLARELNCYILVGAPSTFSRDAGYIEEPRYSLDVQHAANSAVFFNPEGEYIDRYDKMHLVPFGEYVPLVDALPFLGVFTPMTRNLTPGKDAVIFDMETRDGQETSFAAPICYEGIVSTLMRKFKRRGANFFVVPTDEGWYTWPGELRQHVAMAVFRAVETRTTVVRSANTGISCFIDPAGDIYAEISGTADAEKTRRWVQGTVAAAVRHTANTGVYTKTGDVFALGCLLITLFGLFSKYALVVIHHIFGLNLTQPGTPED